MKKALLFLLGLVLVTPAFASVRTDGMGILPVQDNDIDVIWTFPQAIVDYAVVDYRLEYTDDTDDNWGGILHQDKCIGNWGIYLGRPFMGAPYTGVDYIDSLLGGGSILTGAGSWQGIMDEMSTRISDQDIATPANMFDLFKAFKAGNGTLGVKVNYASNKDENELCDADDASWVEGDANGFDPGDQISWVEKVGAKVIGIDVGYGLKKLGPFSSFDMSAGYSTGSYVLSNLNIYQNAADSGPTEYSFNELKGDGINEMRLALRAVKDMTDTTKVVLNANMKTGKLAFAYTSRQDTDYDGVLGELAGEYDASSETYKNTSFGFGANCVHNVHDGLGKVVAGLSLTYAKGNWTSDGYTSLAGTVVADQIDAYNDQFDEATMSYMGIVGNIGVEANLLKWLQIRAGLIKDLMGKTTLDEFQPSVVVANAFQNSYSEKSTWNNRSPVYMNFGVGVNYKNWNIDLLTTTEAMEDFVSDGSLGNGLLYQGHVLNEIISGQLTYNL